MNDRIIYLDNNATTPVADEVLQAMIPFLKEQFFNPSSTYPQARKAAEAVEAARESVARLLGAGSKSEIIFNGGATEGNNSAIWGAARANPARRHVITTAVEHPAVLEVVREMEREGFRATYLPVNRHGMLDAADLIRAIQDDTAVVSIMHANNETGVIFPIGELAALVKKVDPDVVFHTDATQTAGKMRLDLQGELKNVDLLTISGHKLHAPKGVGAMFVRRGSRWRPWQLGGHQERGRRAGTENVASIVGLGAAARLVMTHPNHSTAMRDRLEKAIKDQIPNLFINGEGAPRLANTTNVAFEFVEGESILLALNDHGICVSSGSACTSGSLDPSHVLKAMAVPFTAAHGSLRISTSMFSTDDEIDAVIDVLPTVIARLRAISPYWDVRTNSPRTDVDIFIQGKYR
ncbi:MAG TPA: aminotransferase class V-fold PLP-dependent enzyme [Myxococcota bacterium]|nr:aminotransferase class V-fold PLP-dependent enzyme [Myxococcota bacterium]HOA12633.1 aminotransferase class V-fold PLP-dependent enzyme [Myxococcota bacterium]HOC98687.1 aminotransferase class V-fold PLP-dependent enzyme [Myxococcota bacterium]HOH76201.1 aminotransferase class V-fold PLP-dependent enzyme [Myxococcota bacterium]HPV04383.1 aminotransferase class V-fold PLP-dependent enzyme [Myxococcota bacterium]